MPAFAVITSGVVSNVIDAPADWPQGVNITALAPKPGIGWTYANGTFTAPATPDPGPPPPTTTSYMTQYGWLSRITQPKRTAIRRLGATDDVVEDALLLFQIAGRIDVSLLETQQLVGYLQQLDIIDASDAAALLAPIAIESPHALP